MRRLPVKFRAVRVFPVIVRRPAGDDSLRARQTRTDERRVHGPWLLVIDSPAAASFFNSNLKTRQILYKFDYFFSTTDRYTGGNGLNCVFWFGF
jgi:hypothetical protein